MKLSDIAKNLANRINQQHYIEHELKKVFETAYKLGFEEANKQAQALQLQQTGVMACFSEEQLSQINKYGKHQHNRGTMDLSYVSFEFWLK